MISVQEISVIRRRKPNIHKRIRFSVFISYEREDFFSLKLINLEFVNQKTALTLLGDLFLNSLDLLSIDSRKKYLVVIGHSFVLKFFKCYR